MATPSRGSTRRPYTARRSLPSAVNTVLDGRPSPVDHIRRSALCTARWAIELDAARRAVPSVSPEASNVVYSL